jgi:thermolabile hemolysin
MKVLLFGLAFSSLVSSFAYADSQPVQPDPRYANVLSPSGPLSGEELHRLPPPGSLSRSAHGKTAEAVISKAGSATYTYLRCYYRTGANPTQPTTNYVWGIDPSSGDYYRINGYWWADGLFNWENLFYSSVTQNTLQSICKSTLASNGIQQDPTMVFGANNALSFNYTVWTLDSTNQGPGINKIIAFGDSLSDNQNMFNASLWTLPNRTSWNIGHFGNDKVWVEYLSQRLNLPLYNWAIGGAGVTIKDLVIPGVEQQVQSWLAYMQQAPNYNPAQTLFVMLIGANDLNDGTSVDSIMSGETQALTNLINAGGRNILLLNLPDLTKAPSYQYRSDGATVAAKVVDYNTRLSALATQLRTQYGSTLNIRVFDSYSLLNDVLRNPGAYQVANATQSCLDINDGSPTHYLAGQAARANCTNPDTFVFWDTQHPTAHTHQLLSFYVYNFLTNPENGFASELRKK